VQLIEQDGTPTQFLDASNRFYTLIPHDFGMKKPPLLDTADAIRVRATFVFLTNSLDVFCSCTTVWMIEICLERLLRLWDKVASPENQDFLTKTKQKTCFLTFCGNLLVTDYSDVSLFYLQCSMIIKCASNV